MTLLHIILLLILFVLVRKYWNARKYRLILEQEVKMSRAITQIEKIAIEGIKKNIFLNSFPIYQGMCFITLNRDFKLDLKDIFKSNDKDYLNEINTFKNSINQINSTASHHVDVFLKACGKALLYKNLIKVSIVFICVLGQLLIKKSRLNNVTIQTRNKNISHKIHNLQHNVSDNLYPHSRRQKPA